MSRILNNIFYGVNEMNSHNDVIVVLNKVLGYELIAINQTFLHAKMFRNWGFSELAEKSYKVSIGAMKRADRLAERILFLEGLPNLQTLGKLYIGEDPKEIINCDLKLEMDGLGLLREAILCTEQYHDYVSRDLLSDIMEDEEEYVDWLETQQRLIDDITLENYLQEKL